MVLDLEGAGDDQGTALFGVFDGHSGKEVGWGLTASIAKRMQLRSGAAQAAHTTQGPSFLTAGRRLLRTTPGEQQQWVHHA